MFSAEISTMEYADYDAPTMLGVISAVPWVATKQMHEALVNLREIEHNTLPEKMIQRWCNATDGPQYIKDEYKKTEYLCSMKAKYIAWSVIDPSQEPLYIEPVEICNMSLFHQCGCY